MRFTCTGKPLKMASVKPNCPVRRPSAPNHEKSSKQLSPQRNRQGCYQRQVQRWLYVDVNTIRAFPAWLPGRCPPCCATPRTWKARNWNSGQIKLDQKRNNVVVFPSCRPRSPRTVAEREAPAGNPAGKGPGVKVSSRTLPRLRRIRRSGGVDACCTITDMEVEAYQASFPKSSMLATRSTSKC